MASRQISVAGDFTPFPFGRYSSDDPDRSGEAFRERLLVPALREAEKVEVNLDGIRGGIGSSFLEEVFGGLVRHGYFTEDELRRRLIISCRDDRYVARAWGYVADAGKSTH